MKTQQWNQKIIASIVCTLSIFNIPVNAAAERIALPHNQPVAVIALDERNQHKEKIPPAQNDPVENFEAAGPVQVVAVNQNVTRGNRAAIRVPAGYGRTISNSKFAFQITDTNPNNPMAGNEVLKIRNLVTGQVREVYNKPAAQEDIWDVPNVSPDGKYAVWTTRVAGAGGGFKIYVQDFGSNSAPQEFLITAGVSKAPNAIKFVGDKIEMEIVNAQTQATLGTYVINMNTLQGRLVPFGYVSALSNPNFAFKTTFTYVANGIYNTTLSVRNLVTGAEQVVASGQSFPYGHPTAPYDVSPDGSVVVYGYQNAHTTSGDSSSAIIKRLNNLSQSLNLPGALDSIRFENGEAILSLSNGAIAPTQTVRLQDFTVTKTTYALKNQNAKGITYSPEARLVTEVTKIVNTEYLRIYDATAGINQMTLLVNRPVTTGYPSDQVKFVNIYQTPQGRSIVSYAADTYAPSLEYDYHTVLIDPRTGGQLTIDGFATSVTFDGAIARYELIHRMGTKSVVFVDLGTLKTIMPPVPAGFIRFIANPAFAYQVSFTNPPITANEVLKISNLLTGQIYEVYNKPVSQEDIWDQPNVSPNGRYVVWTTRVAGPGPGFKIYAYDLSLNTTHEYLIQTGVSNAPNAIKFSGNEIQLEIVNAQTPSIILGVYRIDVISWQGALTRATLAQAHFMRDVETSEGLKKIYYLSQNGRNSILVYNPATKEYNQYSVPANYNPTLNNGDALTIPAQSDYAILTMGSNGQIIEISLKNQPEPVRSVQLRDPEQDGVVNLGWIGFGRAQIDTKLGRQYILMVGMDGRLSLVEFLPPPVPAGWLRMPGNAQLAFKTENGKHLVLNLQTNETRPMTVSDITSMDEADMLGYFSRVTGFPAYGLSLTADVIDAGGRLRPVVQVAYILQTPVVYSFQSKGTLFFDLMGKLENAHETAPYRPLPVGEFLPGQCTKADMPTPGVTTSCVGVFVADQGLREIHSYTGGANTGILIYNLAANDASESFSLPSLDPITAANFSIDGKYLAVASRLDQLTVIALNEMKNLAELSVVPPIPANADIQSVQFLKRNWIQIMMKDGRTIMLRFKISATGELIWI